MRAHECLKGVSAPRATPALGEGEGVEGLGNNVYEDGRQGV